MINANFFEDGQVSSKNLESSDKRSSSPQQMIEVFMTPQSDDDLSKESISPSDSSP